MLARSSFEPARRAEMMPTPSPVTTQITAPPSTSEIVAGRRLAISSFTGAFE